MITAITKNDGRLAEELAGNQACSQGVRGAEHKEARKNVKNLLLKLCGKRKML